MQGLYGRGLDILEWISYFGNETDMLFVNRTIKVSRMICSAVVVLCAGVIIAFVRVTGMACCCVSMLFVSLLTSRVKHCTSLVRLICATVDTNSFP